MEHPLVTYMRQQGFSGTEPVLIDYFGTEIFADEYYFDFEGEVVHEDDVEKYLYEAMGVRRKQA